ncbi:hyalin-like [Glandiceps talaboti]
MISKYRTNVCDAGGGLYECCTGWDETPGGDDCTLDIDECSLYTSGCVQVCTNNPGSFTCSSVCGTGYMEFSSICFDVEVPVISPNCPTDIDTVNDPGLPYGTVTYTPPSATDNSGYVFESSSHNSGDTFTIGSTTVSYAFLDNDGLASNCDFAITVWDIEAPVIGTPCPSDIMTVTDAGVAYATQTYTPPDATDNSGTVYTTSTHNSGDTFNIGTTTVTYTFTDDSGMFADCSFDVNVFDIEAPVIGTPCPSDIMTVTDAGVAYATQTYTPPDATDNSGTVYTTSTHNSGDTFNIGTTTVTYTFTDDSGIFADCSFDVNVFDSEAPVIGTSCPSDIMTVTDAGVAYATQTYTPPDATDNSGTVYTTSTHNSGDTFNIGTTTVTYTFTDDSGMFADCSFDVNVFV